MATPEALSVFFTSISQIDNRKLDLVGLVTASDALKAVGLLDHGIVLYKYWMLSNGESQILYLAAYNCAVQLIGLGRIDEAQQMLSRSITLKPDFTLARLTLANTYERQGNKPKAIATLQSAIEHLTQITSGNVSSKVLALKNIARLKRNTAEAEAALKEAAELDPTQAELVQHWINTRQTRCSWPALQPLGALSIEEIKNLLAPLTGSMILDDPQYLLRVSASYTRQQIGSAGMVTHGAWPVPIASTREKLRIGYMSSDLCNHAIGYLMTDVFKHHDRKRYEIRVYNIGERTRDPLQEKVYQAVDSWTDVKPMPDKQAAKAILDDGIDILLDINGHTNFQRTRLLAMKPAPIIANWLGYPGTMGSEFHDYIIADDFIIPPTHERFYSEQVLRLPCYQPNGALIGIPQPKLSRVELGLPEKGFVFCCFNGAIKITSQIFSRWMTILRAVPGSVLWLRGGGSDDAPIHLREEAARQGVEGHRLVVLPFQSNTEYLACHRYADLFLDTFPYGAHTTASDSLRMGVPIVTLPGDGFPSRVCASLSSAAGIPEMICRSPREYVDKAIHLATHPGELQAIRSKLSAGLPTCTLFDSAKLVRHLEELFETMWQDYCTGKLQQPKDFRIYARPE
jgi:predicted O-linked N-acetylglucosamine transferase (SPINDLY family)